MSLAKLFHRAWNILRHNRLIWLLSLIYAAAFQVTSFLPEDSQKIGWYCGLGCLELWFLIAMVETDAGMVYATDQQLNEQPYSFREGWKFVRPRTVGLVVTYFLFTLTFIAAALLLSIAIMVLLYILTYLVTRASIAKDIYPITLVGVFIATFFVGGPALSFGIRAILLEQMSTFRGLLRGWAIYRRNFRQSLAANIIFFGLSLGIKAAASVITFLLAEPVKLSNLMGGSYTSYIWQ